MKSNLKTGILASVTLVSSLGLSQIDRIKKIDTDFTSKVFTCKPDTDGILYWDEYVLDVSVDQYIPLEKAYSYNVELTKKKMKQIRGDGWYVIDDGEELMSSTYTISGVFVDYTNDDQNKYLRMPTNDFEQPDGYPVELATNEYFYLNYNIRSGTTGSGWTLTRQSLGGMLEYNCKN